MRSTSDNGKTVGTRAKEAQLESLKGHQLPAAELLLDVNSSRRESFPPPSIDPGPARHKLRCVLLSSDGRAKHLPRVSHSRLLFWKKKEEKKDKKIVVASLYIIILPFPR